MSKHTPGPWTAFRDVDGGFTVATDGGREVVRGLLVPANAALIAAAPDMLAALDALMHTTDDDLNYLAVCQQARAAIAKAGG